MARLYVLYEDLRIEAFGCAADYIKGVDILDPPDDYSSKAQVGAYRRHYFLRRSIGTMYEFAEGLRILDANEEFAEIKAQWPPELKTLWDSGISFFHEKEAFIKKVRHDVGGHFSSSAALYAAKHLLEGTPGVLELSYDDQGRMDAKFHFAGAIAAAAFLRWLPGETVEEKAETFIGELLTNAYSHATDCVQTLLLSGLWSEFGLER
jgi:hypothetical protein